MKYFLAHLIGPKNWSDVLISFDGFFQISWIFWNPCVGGFLGSQLHQNWLFFLELFDKEILIKDFIFLF